MTLGKLFILAAPLLVFVCGVNAYAQNIAVIDAAAVVNETNAAKRAIDVLRKKTEEAQGRIDKMEAELEEKRQQLEKKRDVLSEEIFEKEKMELSREFRDFRNKAQQIQEGLDEENMGLRKEITDEIRAVVEEIAKERNLDIVIAENLLIYSKNTIDISDEVLKRVNKRLDR